MASAGLHIEKETAVLPIMKDADLHPPELYLQTGLPL